MRISKSLFIFIIMSVLLITFGYLIGSYLNEIRDEGVQYETGLNAQFLSNQNYLSAYISGFYEQVGVANVKSEKMHEILTDAVTGRYGKEGFSAKGAFFSAVKEAYPDLAQLGIYDKIIIYVSAQREGYKNIQDKFLDMLRNYDSWRARGLLRSQVIKSILGYPSERLIARIGTESWTGTTALEKMYTIVLAGEVKQAYQTGKYPPMRIDQEKK